MVPRCIADFLLRSRPIAGLSRRVGPGETFGEVSLLQSGSLRTGTAIVEGVARLAAPVEEEPAAGAAFLYISRQHYDATVRSTCRARC